MVNVRNLGIIPYYFIGNIPSVLAKHFTSIFSFETYKV